MKRVMIVIGLFCCILTPVLSGTYVDPAFAQGDKHFISSSQGNGIWILNRSSGKMIYLQFKAEDKTWQSYAATVPSNIDLNKCQINAFGRRGAGVLLVDASSGVAIAYRVKGDHTIQSGISLHFDQNFMLTGRADNFWVLNTASKEITFIQFKNVEEIKKSPPLPVPSNFHLDNCTMKAVGTHGEGVFLFDTLTGSTNFYKIDGRNLVIHAFENIAVGSDLAP